MKKMRSLCLYIAFSFVFSSRIFSQQEEISAEIRTNDTTFSVLVPGQLDAFNTRKYQNESIFYYRGAVKSAGIENNVELSLENQSSQVISNPQIQINNKRLLYTFRDWVSEIDLTGLTTADDTVKAVWSYLTTHYYHWLVSTEPDVFNIKPLKTYSVFGSGHCENVSQVFVSLMKYIGYVQSRVKIIADGAHTIGTVTLGDGREIILDGDIQVFYTNRSNSRLADFQELFDDQDLVRRHHHYGFTAYEGDGDNSLALFYSDRMDRSDKDTWWEIDSLTLSIRQQERFSFRYQISPGPYYQFRHGLNEYNTNPPGPPPTAALGLQSYTPKLNTDFLNQASQISNITAVGEKSLQASVPGQPATVVVLMPNPYVITNGKVVFRYERNAADTSSYLKVYFKRIESSSYALVYESSRNDTGMVIDSVDLFDKIIPVGNWMLNEYLIKLEWYGENIGSIVVDSLSLESFFQFNPAAIPRLKVGKNEIRLTSSNATPFDGLVYRHTFVEHNESLPPPAVNNPIFPEDNGEVFSTDGFYFDWNLPTGTSLVDIKDFHIQVSDRSDFRFPLSPTTNKIKSQNPNLPAGTAWRIQSQGLLNPGQTYYWRVALQSNDGVWGEWSPVWRFSVQVPGIIINPKVIKDGDSVVIHWDPSAIGTTPVQYLILADYTKGFSYNPILIIDTVTTNQFAIHNTRTILDYPFYRIIAVDADGGMSPVSELISVAPVTRVLYDSVSTIKAGIPVNIRLRTINPQDISGQGFSNPVITFIDSVSLIFDSLPQGLHYENGTIRGMIMIRDSTPIDIRYHSISDPVVKELKMPYTFRYPQYAPEFVVLPDTVASEDSNYQHRTYAVDMDSSEFADTVQYTLLSGPSWLTLDSLSGQFRGTPQAENVGDTVIVIKATDRFGESDGQQYILHVIHVNHAPTWITNPVANAVEDSLYEYNAFAKDQDSALFGDTVRYRLVFKPGWMSIDSLSGKISGIPRDKDNIDVPMILKASDNKGSAIEQSWNLTVTPTYYPPQSFGLGFPVSLDTMTIFKNPKKRMFVWFGAKDPDATDTLIYDLRLYSTNWDTVITGIMDTSVMINDSLFAEESWYGWTVSVFDTRFEVLSADSFIFFTTKRLSSNTYVENPQFYALFQNYPNPFNPATTVRFQVPEESDVRIEVYNILGQQVDQIFKGKLTAKYYEMEWRPKAIASGIYFVKFNAEGIVSRKKYQSVRKLSFIK